MRLQESMPIPHYSDIWNFEQQITVHMVIWYEWKDHKQFKSLMVYRVPLMPHFLKLKSCSCLGWRLKRCWRWRWWTPRIFIGSCHTNDAFSRLLASLLFLVVCACTPSVTTDLQESEMCFWLSMYRNCSFISIFACFVGYLYMFLKHKLRSPRKPPVLLLDHLQPSVHICRGSLECFAKGVSI